jgi:hypothetical protein
MPAPIVRSVTILRSVGGLSFDATFEERHRSELEVPEDPLETGVTITDHSFMKPLSLSMKVGVTNTPLTLKPNDSFSGSSQTRIQAAFNLLRALQASGTPFAVQTGLFLYPQVLCKVCEVDQDASTANALVFDLELREVIFVSTQTVVYPHRAVKHSGAKVTQGKKQPTQVTEPTKAGSILGTVFDVIEHPESATTSQVSKIIQTVTGGQGGYLP